MNYRNFDSIDVVAKENSLLRAEILAIGSRFNVLEEEAKSHAYEVKRRDDKIELLQMEKDNLSCKVDLISAELKKAYEGTDVNEILDHITGLFNDYSQTEYGECKVEKIKGMISNLVENYEYEKILSTRYHNERADFRGKAICLEKELEDVKKDNENNITIIEDLNERGFKLGIGFAAAMVGQLVLLAVAVWAMWH